MSRKRKAEQAAEDVLDVEEEACSTITKGHPYGVQPMGNQLLSSVDCRPAGLGVMAVLPDDVLLLVLGLASPRCLCSLSSASPAAYVVAHHADLWRTLVLEEFPSGFTFAGASWKETLLSNRGITAPHRPLQFPFFSDTLFGGFVYTAMEVAPAWLDIDNMDRREAASFTVDDFVANYETPRRPVLIQGAAKDWPALKKWNREYLEAAHGAKSFRCGPIDMSMAQFFSYSDHCVDDNPMYLFDCKFGSTAPDLAGDYVVPPYFEDLLGLLGPDKRPDFRWLIIGGARTGSKWHIDPNSTNAWNTTITGSKLWIMLPPLSTPPGVHPAPDGSAVAQPVNILEWFTAYYSAMRRVGLPAVQCITRPGDTVYVPCGWWHLVLNLEPYTIAVTQNYISRRNLLTALDFIRKTPHLVSGIDVARGSKTPAVIADRLEAAFEAAHPGELDTLRAAHEAATRPSPWAAATSTGDRGFSFGF